VPTDALTVLIEREALYDRFRRELKNRERSG
jgi:hypothetical protein